MIGDRTTADAFGDAAAAMVSDYSVTDVLAQLLADCAELVGAEAVAILVVDKESSELSLLSSSSHRASELELLQIQGSSGPCVESIRTGEHVTATGAGIAERWDGVGRAIADSGFARVDAYPMRWRGRVLGGLNIFRLSDAEVESDIETLSQAFADVATLVVVQSIEIPEDQITARVHDAIMARTQVEQAKGVLAYLRGIDMAEAYEELRRMAADQDRSLTQTANDVIREQHETSD